jgi:hypothetical protein
MQALTEFPFKTGRCALLSRGQPLSVIYGGLQQESPNKKRRFVPNKRTAFLTEAQIRVRLSVPARADATWNI